ncbi:hypothetical protein BD289DRAFT_462803 [Coniella lustricola]|uniref:RecQ-mediated genome instability protein 1 n=1 Tax=Coniella lustricola TaxID=2025994 RepID=A0A2T2ZYZ9_9PEZI|nr:hypothetical protein BD289DRAFT_462803 [Coniella lustricola]
MGVVGDIGEQLHAYSLPPPSQAWLQEFVSSRHPPPPINSLVMTAKARLLASDLTTPGLLDSAKVFSQCLPEDITSVSTKEKRLDTNVHVQVIDVENMAKSRWEQVEHFEAIARGEQTRGREVIRLPTTASNEDEPDNTSAGSITATAYATRAQSNATHRLTLQDSRGQKVYGLELVRMPQIAIGSLNIGSKILLKRGTVVARGIVLLEPATCQILGGKIETLQKAWLASRLVYLKGAAGAPDEERA